MEQQNVFLVWTGSYEDKQVVAVLSGRPLAEEFVRELQTPDSYGYIKDAWIVEMPLNTQLPELHGWVCLMGMDGDNLYVEHSDAYRFSASPEVIAAGKNPLKLPRRVLAYGTTREGAIKNASDFRRAVLARETIIPDAR